MNSNKKTPQKQEVYNNLHADKQGEKEGGMENTHLITQVELEGHQFEPIKDPMKELYRIQQKITNKMYELDQLNWQYYDKQEKLFLKTFINIMDRMSNELQIYKQKYDNIDQEIDQQPECVELRNKMRFYRDECLFLNSQLKKQEKELEELQTLNSERSQTNDHLRAELLRQFKKQYQYSSRRYSLESRLNSNHQETKGKDYSNKSFSFQAKQLKGNEHHQESLQIAEPRARYSTARMEQSYTIQIKTPDEVKKNRRKICSTTITSKQQGQLDIHLGIINPAHQERREKTARDRIRYYH